MRIVPTIEAQQLPYADISLASPDQQFEALVAIIENNDAANPAPYTGTPPYGEPTPEDEYISDAYLSDNYLPQPDTEAQAEVDLNVIVADAYPTDIPEWAWQNDDQYFGLAVPPGIPNFGQPIESGHTQITLPDPSSEVGWDAWAGKPVLARVARHENNFPLYMAGQTRGHEITPTKIYQGIAVRTQQARDLLLAEIMRRGIHNVVVADVPSVPYTEQVQVVDPMMMTPEPEIGPEGVLP